MVDEVHMYAIRVAELLDSRASSDSRFGKTSIEACAAFAHMMHCLTWGSMSQRVIELQVKRSRG